MTNEILVVPASGTDAEAAADDDHNDDDGALPHDEEASYCSTTSAESLASENEHHDADAEGEAADTIASPTRRTVRTPSFSYDDLARRPRSNPRTRTPLRNPSPLLEGLREPHVTSPSIANVTHTSNAARHVPGQAGVESPQARAAPQDAGSAANEAGRSAVSFQAQAQPQTQQQQQQRVTIRLNAGLPVGSLPSSSDRTSTTARRYAQQQQSQQQRSSKQGPSRRKLRRWTNDSMRSIAVDIALASQSNPGRRNLALAAADVYARTVTDDANAERKEYELPNAPRQYRSSFDVLTRLVDRWEVVGDGEDDKHDNGEDVDEDGTGHGTNPAVSNKKKNRDQFRKKELERKRRAELLAARDRFLRGETAAATAALVPTHTKELDFKLALRYSSGEQMFQHLDARIRSIVVRAVSVVSASSTPYATRLLDAFEDVLVHRKMSLDDSRKMVDEVLARPLVIGDGDIAGGGGGGVDADAVNNCRNKKANKGDKKNKKKKGNKVGSMAYRFHFDVNPPPTIQGGNRDNTGFHRLLLHSVCQFHGMVTTSSTTTFTCKQSEKKTTERVLTVTGMCRGREHRIVAEACRHVARESQ